MRTEFPDNTRDDATALMGNAQLLRNIAKRGDGMRTSNLRIV